VLLQLDIQTKNFPTKTPASARIKANTIDLMGIRTGAIAVPGARIGADESTAAKAAERRSLRSSS
jgi:hypothetical protein